MRSWQIGAIVALSAVLAGCQTDQQATADVPPPDARSAIVAARGQLWKDPDSIKNASLTAPRRHNGFMWHVCVRANAKNSFGGYTGEKDMLVGLYDDGKPPSIIMADATGYCNFPHEPLPEVESGYRPPSAKHKT